MMHGGSVGIVKKIVLTAAKLRHCGDKDQKQEANREGDLTDQLLIF